MVGSRSLTPIAEQDYEAIELAVMETARGRWFLSEFSRRNRHADTEILLQAIARLDGAVQGPGQGVERIRYDLLEMAKAIARTKAEIAALHAPDHEQGRLTEVSEALDGIVRTTERATSDILEAAERVQEVGWTLREGGGDEAVCGELDRRATEIYTACSFQDLTAQRTGRIVSTLRFLESRINVMMEIWGTEAPGEEAPATPGADATPDLSQSDIDLVIAAAAERGGPAPARAPAAPLGLVAEEDLVFVEDSVPVDLLVEERPVPILTPSRLPIAQAFAEIDGLSVAERLRRFT